MTDKGEFKGWVLYDGVCHLCVRMAMRWRRLLGAAGFNLEPIQTRMPAEPVIEMIVVTPEGYRYGGADAVLYIARQIWWARPLVWIGESPLVRRTLDRAYKALARRRYCMNGICELRKNP
jgi:predicted DCC family thiol-disulfide oxidoreductase YuxK